MLLLDEEQERRVRLFFKMYHALKALKPIFRSASCPEATDVGHMVDKLCQEFEETEQELISGFEEFQNGIGLGTCPSSDSGHSSNSRPTES